MQTNSGRRLCLKAQFLRIRKKVYSFPLLRHAYTKISVWVVKHCWNDDCVYFHLAANALLSAFKSGYTYLWASLQNARQASSLHCFRCGTQVRNAFHRRHCLQSTHALMVTWSLPLHYLAHRHRIQLYRAAGAAMRSVVPESEDIITASLDVAMNQHKWAW